MLAHTYLCVAAAIALSSGSGLIPVTLGEVRRLPAHLTATLPGRCAAWHGPAGAADTSTAPELATTSAGKPDSAKCCWSIECQAWEQVLCRASAFVGAFDCALSSATFGADVARQRITRP